MTAHLPSSRLHCKLQHKPQMLNKLMGKLVCTGQDYERCRQHARESTESVENASDVDFGRMRSAACRPGADYVRHTNRRKGVLNRIDAIFWVFLAHTAAAERARKRSLTGCRGGPRRQMQLRQASAAITSALVCLWEAELQMRHQQENVLAAKCEEAR